MKPEKAKSLEDINEFYTSPEAIINRLVCATYIDPSLKDAARAYAQGLISAVVEAYGDYSLDKVLRSVCLEAEGICSSIVLAYMTRIYGDAWSGYLSSSQHATGTQIASIAMEFVAIHKETMPEGILWLIAQEMRNDATFQLFISIVKKRLSSFSFYVGVRRKKYNIYRLFPNGRLRRIGKMISPSRLNTEIQARRCFVHEPPDCSFLIETKEESMIRYRENIKKNAKNKRAKK